MTVGTPHPRLASRRRFAGWTRTWLAWLGAGIIAGTIVAMWQLMPSTSDGLGAVEAGWRAIVAPRDVFEQLLASGDAAAFGWWYTLGYAALYSGTAALLAGRGFVPQTPPTLPIPERDFYAWQTLFTVPAGVAATGLGCLAAFGLASTFGADVGLGDLWGPFAIAMVVPTFLTMWIPETIGPFVTQAGATTDRFPEQFNLGRILVGSVWSVVLGVVAVAATGLAVWASVFAGVVGAAIVGSMFVALR